MNAGSTRRFVWLAAAWLASGAAYSYDAPLSPAKWKSDEAEKWLTGRLR